MKSTGKALLILLVIAALIACWGISTYNSIVRAEEAVNACWADVETQLQRRADLIPNLVSTVKGYMQHESGVIDSITESRERLLSADNMQDRAQASADLTAAVDQLFVLVENYPDLKANENFIALQDELAGTENRIATARKDYNQAVNSYNTEIKRFPGAFFARSFGFEKAEYFEAAAGSEQVPSVDFN